MRSERGVEIDTAENPKRTPSVSDDLSVVVARIRAAEQVALACHVHPDGDALGSMLALHHALRAAGIESVASFSEPFVIAPHYRDLPGLDLLTKPIDFPAAPELMITFDCGSKARLGDLEPTAEAAAELVVLDHHISNDRYGTVNVILPEAPATGAVVLDLIDRLGIELDRDIAMCLYAALVCDTGRFQYDTTTPEVFAMAARLAGFDLPIARLSRALFEEHRFDYLQMVGEALTNAEFDEERRFVWTIVSREMLARFGVTTDEVEGLIDLVRRTAEAEIACVLKQEADGHWRVSLRSVGKFDVSELATRFGGGGHRFAAGFTSEAPAAEIVRELLAAI